MWYNRWSIINQAWHAIAVLLKTKFWNVRALGELAASGHGLVKDV
jgi:hypothetical protein